MLEDLGQADAFEITPTMAAAAERVYHQFCLSGGCEEADPLLMIFDAYQAMRLAQHHSEPRNS